MTLLEEVCPNDLGDNNHRWSWLMEVSGGEKNILWVHNCLEGKPALMWIDITTGGFHRLVSANPLTIEPSILCPVCQDHGFIKEDKWI